MNTAKKPAISIVSPVYMCADALHELVQKIKYASNEISDNFEIILVDDGSPDGAWLKIREECKKDKRVKGVSLSRNFGQHFAITAGLAHTSGDVVVVMDCDLQDDPKYIPELYNELQQGYGIVFAKKESRQHGALKNLASAAFYKAISWISDFKLDPEIGNYTILSRKAVDSFLSFNDYRRGYIFVLSWIGFRTSQIMVEHNARVQGKSSYSLSKLISLALNLALSYSDKPLRVAIYTGLAFAVVALTGLMFLVWQYFFRNIIPGWTSTVVVITLVGGIIMIFLGIIGLYISKIFEQTKQRPLYVVDNKENL